MKPDYASLFRKRHRRHKGPRTAKRLMVPDDLFHASTALARASQTNLNEWIVDAMRAKVMKDFHELEQTS